MIQQFIDKYGIELAIEPTDRNPLGPQEWQEHFRHFSLWITNKTTREQIPQYVSFQPGNPQLPAPDALYIFENIAHGLYAYGQGFDHFWHLTCPLSLPERQVRFYFEQVGRTIRSFERLFGKEALEEFMQIGADLDRP